MNIDLALDAAELKESNAYAGVIQMLEEGDSYRNETGEYLELCACQLGSTVDPGDGGLSVTVQVDLLVPDGLTLSKRHPPLVRRLHTMAMKGIALAPRHARETQLVGRTLQGRREQTTLREVNPDAFTVIRELALMGRRESKNACDICT